MFARSLIIGSLILVAAPCAAFAAGAGCDIGKWPASPTEAKFSASLPAVANGDLLPALGAPVTVNLAPQGEVTFAHAPARQGKANPAYAAVVKLGPEPAAVYQVTTSSGAWVDLAENNDLVKSSGYERVKDCPGVDKVIRFKTAGGPLAVQISGSYAKTIKIAVERVE
ncbi:MAG TPA: hypothetical protein VGY52_12605 [Roseiarcus sp.]|jgi:hypothetical protein|nr:hypothetical protein [Roseiarcus sp.]